MCAYVYAFMWIDEVIRRMTLLDYFALGAGAILALGYVVWWLTKRGER